MVPGAGIERYNYNCLKKTQPFPEILNARLLLQDPNQMLKFIGIVALIP